jgi:hypothetical protein
MENQCFSAGRLAAEAQEVAARPGYVSCPTCGRDVHVNKDGTLHIHSGYGYRRTTPEFVMIPGSLSVEADGLGPRQPRQPPPKGILATDMRTLIDSLEVIVQEATSYGTLTTCTVEADVTGSTVVAVYAEGDWWLRWSPWTSS